MAMLDPNPRVSGKGAAILRKAGIAVEVGLLSKEAAQLNEVFIKNMMVQKPFIAVKLAQSSTAARHRGRAIRNGLPTNGPGITATICAPFTTAF